jgi:hypothetical protein
MDMACWLFSGWVDDENPCFVLELLMLSAFGKEHVQELPRESLKRVPVQKISLECVKRYHSSTRKNATSCRRNHMQTAHRQDSGCPRMQHLGHVVDVNAPPQQEVVTTSSASVYHWHECADNRTLQHSVLVEWYPTQDSTPELLG